MVHVVAPALHHRPHSEVAHVEVAAVDRRALRWQRFGHPGMHAVLTAFHERTGVPVLLNTSFNVAGMPIVRSPAEALDCAVRAGLDAVVLEHCLVDLTQGER